MNWNHLRGMAATALLATSTAFAEDVPAVLAPAQAPAPAPAPAPAATAPQAVIVTEAPAAEESSEPEVNHLSRALLGECFAKRSGLRLGGWTEISYTHNFDKPLSNVNFPLTFGWRAQELMMNQSYLFLERAVAADKFDLGFRIDAFYGTDYIFTEALGLERENDFTQKWNKDNPTAYYLADFYGLAMPQAYAEVNAPIAEGLSTKVGHFYTPLGSDGVMPGTRFFFSCMYAHQYGEPFTHTGVLSTLKLSDKLSVYGGVVRGWDSWIDNNNALSFVTGFSSQLTDKTNVGFGILSGAEQDEPRTPPLSSQLTFQDPGSTANRTSYAVVVTQKVGCKLTAILQHDFGYQHAGAIGLVTVPGGAPTVAVRDAYWYGVNTRFQYELTEKLFAGLRLEWFRDEDGVRVVSPQGGTFADTSYYQLTGGLNIKPCDNVIIRPEVRWDRANRNAYNDFTENNMLTFGGDIVIKY